MKFFQHRQTPVFFQRAPGMVHLVLALSLIAVSLTACEAQQQARQQVAGNANPGLSPASSPSFSHIFTIVLENKEYTTIIGKSYAPYLNSLVSISGLATQYYAIGHPSLPNYMALTGGSTFGITSDCTTCFQHAQNLADQIEASGRTWKAYMENMPSPCYAGDSPDGLYAQKHDPFLYYDDIRTNHTRCTTHVVPFTQFTTDLSGNQLPAYVWITPNICHDMHSCSVADGDTWLSQVVPLILQSVAFTHNGLLFITFDEGETSASCCNDALGGQVTTLVISPLVKKGFQSTILETHYSLLRTVEEVWGLPFLGEASKSTAMTEYFMR
jgi:phosphatidylinositol-3-phosphatase